MKIKGPIIPLILATLPFLFSCRPTRYVPEGQSLLVRNRVEMTDKKQGIDKDEIISLAHPKPNKRFLGMVPMKLAFYNMGMKGKEDSKFRKWLREKVGERPSEYDSLLVKNSTRKIAQYLEKVGFFHSDVSFRTDYRKNKRKVAVTYIIYPARPYKLRRIRYDIPDSMLRSFILADTARSKLKKEQNFNAFKLEDERNRISTNLQEHGYYYFNLNFIYYEIDSSLNSHEMDISIHTKAETLGEDSTSFNSMILKRYKINDIFIRPDYDPLAPPSTDLDTVHYQYQRKKSDSPPISYHIIHRGPLKINPSTLAQSIFMKEGDIYNVMDVKKTRSRATELGLFGYANIRFQDVTDKDSTREEFGELNCNIDLSKRKLHAFTVEAEGTTTGGRPGVGFIFTYQNNNIFRGSEIFRMRAHFALEAQKAIGSSEDITPGTGLFNKVTSGVEFSIDLPRFLAPIKQERFPKYFRPMTSIRLGFGYEKRELQYTRTLSNISFGYNWKESETKRHLLTPLDFSIVKVNNTPEFQDTIDNNPNNRIKNQYTDHLIMCIHYNFIFNNQNINKLSNFIFFKAGIETAGNLLGLFYNLFGTKKEDQDYYTLFGIQYAQYVKTDYDFRYYNVINRNNTMAYRFYLGVGVPYGNADILPLEKGFYGGGANGMRGWPFRLLGPGGYDNLNDNFDKMGDIQLEANVEYRFPIYKVLKSALFIDAGNIWLINDSTSFPGGEFKFNKFYKEIAVDMGVGIRLDFNFFILRVDLAIPVRNPAYPPEERWRFSKLQFNDFMLNFGIGYPF